MDVRVMPSDVARNPPRTPKPGGPNSFTVILTNYAQVDPQNVLKARNMAAEAARDGVPSYFELDDSSSLRDGISLDSLDQKLAYKRIRRLMSPNKWRARLFVQLSRAQDEARLRWRIYVTFGTIPTSWRSKRTSR
jgi:hypothetical protein